MTKKKSGITIMKVFDILSAMAVVGFAVILLRDYRVYKTTLNSAPFYIWIIVDCLYFLIPAIILFISGRIFRK